MISRSRCWRFLWVIHVGLQMETYVYDLVGAFEGELVGDFVGISLDILSVILWRLWMETCLVILLKYFIDTWWVLLWDSIMRLLG